MTNSTYPIPKPLNEPVLTYGAGSLEKAGLKRRLDEMLHQELEIPLLIGGEEVRTGNTLRVLCPHDHEQTLATCHLASEREVAMAIEAAAEAWQDWSRMPLEARAGVFLKAADLLAGPWRHTLNAATMLNQSKTAYQAEIDSACELIDFWRFNPYYAQLLYGDQPSSVRGQWNHAEYRPLEGFIFAVTPFNFTSIAGNLPTAPAIMGNTVLWKPASTALYSGYYLMRLLEAAGLPKGVLNFLPGRGGEVGDPALASDRLAGIHFTGSTAVFQGMWLRVGNHISRYRSYPRIVGETGGKDFVFAHPSADVEALAVALVRGAFEYQGQKCSAASRAYVPESLWPRLKELVQKTVSEIEMGSPLDFRNFMAAVIDRSSFRKIGGYIEQARSDGLETVTGGGLDDSIGYFVEPTVIRTEDPTHALMREEIFGPVLTIFVYPDRDLDRALELCDTTSPYALTGAVFANDRQAITAISQRLCHSAGNFYINDKPTGAVVGQQPFGGSRASGTNDKAGSKMNLLRWTSVRSVKETFVPPTDIRYPHMAEE